MAFSAVADSFQMSSNILYRLSILTFSAKANFDLKMEKNMVSWNAGCVIENGYPLLYIDLYPKYNLGGSNIEDENRLVQD